MDVRSVSAVLAGSVGGVLGTAVLQKGLQLAPKLPQELRPPPLKEDPGEFMIRQAESLAGRALPERVHSFAAKGLHWGYGTLWSTLLGAIVRNRKISMAQTVGAGAALGAFVWALGFAGWLPATGLASRLPEERVSEVTSGLLSHAVYGVVAALPIYVASKLVPEPKIPAWKRFLFKALRG